MKMLADRRKERGRKDVEKSRQIKLTLTESQYRHLCVLGMTFDRRPSAILRTLVEESMGQNPLRAEAAMLWGHLDEHVRLLRQIRGAILKLEFKDAGYDERRTQLLDVKAALDSAMVQLQAHRRWLMNRGGAT